MCFCVYGFTAQYMCNYNKHYGAGKFEDCVS